jgi:hypothetical protein
MCTVLLLPAVKPIAVNKYVISYRIISYIINMTTIFIVLTVAQLIQFETTSFCLRIGTWQSVNKHAFLLMYFTNGKC